MEPNGDGKKVICLGMPSYGELTSGAAIGLYRPSKRQNYDVQIFDHKSSLLASNMNALWCWALNKAQSGRCDYFAMMHADIEPPEFWLDTLIDELEAKSLDVLGVVAPIKDQRGVTSIALARDDGDPWKVHCRLTMKEVFRLPETFTTDDLNGYKLLINTGLWVCKFDIEWAYAVCFTINDRIVYDPEAKIWFPQVEPEDWNVSRQFHKLGLKVGCTRKVELGHRGYMAFGNNLPWGEHEFDKEQGITRSVLDDVPPIDWFPHKAAGWLTEAEGRELARLAEGKTVLEIGAYCGRSTICLAQKAKSVSSIDTFDGRGTAMQGSTLQTFLNNLRRAGVRQRVTEYVGTSEELLPNLPPVYDLGFIDGSHDEESVLRDAALVTECLKPGGLLVFHDYGRPEKDFEVTAAVDELICGGAELLSRCESLAVVRPSKAANLVTV